jgi:OOP family OmpA-OmpF porin
MCRPKIETFEKGGRIMKRSCLRVIFFLFIGGFLANCAIFRVPPQPAPTLFEAPDLNPKLQSGDYKPKVDNLMVIIDGSGSMHGVYKGHNKLDFAKGVVSGLNKTIPDMKLTSGLRMFGRRTPGSRELTELLYGMKKHSKAEFETALSTIIYPRGDSLLDFAIHFAQEDLKAVRGSIALIIVSDGKNMTKEAPIKSARAIKDSFGGRLCIYTVTIGDDPAGKKLLEQIAQVGQCGFSMNAEDIASAAGMAGFVESVFLKRKMDDDGDGVPDHLDKCPNTPRGVKVDQRGCTLDSDGDGVPDHLDKCPNTPEGVKVDALGCPLDTDGDGVADHLDKCPDTPKGATVNWTGCWALGGMVLFDFDKYDIKLEAYPALNEVVTVLKKNPEMKVEIQGHTDSKGTARYNQKLSERRADAILEYFVRQGIERERLSAAGLGSTRPIASNVTEDGMAQNRRVEFRPIRD